MGKRTFSPQRRLYRRLIVLKRKQLSTMDDDDFEADRGRGPRQWTDHHQGLLGGMTHALAIILDVPPDRVNASIIRRTAKPK